MKNGLAFILYLVWMGCVFGSEIPRKNFDFAGAERLADQQLKRVAVPPPPIEKLSVIPPMPANVCKTCKGVLTVPCPHHATVAPFITETPTDADFCKMCLGTGLTACATCKNQKPAENAIGTAIDIIKLLAEKEKVAIKELQQIAADGPLPYKLTAYATPHVAIGTTLPRKSITPCLLHCEGLIKKLNDLFATTPDKQGTFDFFTAQDMHFFLLNTQGEFDSFVKKISIKRSPTMDVALTLKMSGTYTFTLPSTAVDCFEKVKKLDDMLQHQVVHQLAHLAVNRLAGVRGLPAWLSEGFAAHAESMELKQPEIYCCAYVENKVDILSSRMAALKRLSQAPPTKEKLFHLSYMDMKAEDYFMAWSIVAMLIDRSPDKFHAFLLALPEGKQEPDGLRIEADDQEKALKDVYGYDYEKLICIWKLWLTKQ